MPHPPTYTAPKQKLHPFRLFLHDLAEGEDQGVCFIFLADQAIVQRGGVVRRGSSTLPP
ncbi:hypothetical protein [Lactobacillus delbrueckii]|uniref:hypothetical protein n=1 Tax=Lactobacillus delbrueckii TaxID=1584 RepID=UPI0038555B74